MSGLLALGVSHRTAPLSLREQLALTEGRAAGVLNALVSEEPISEAAALSTCNRTELYLVTTDSVEAETAGLGVLAREAGIPPTELLGPLYSLRAAEAARHLYRVTAGLDSMILGEAEIQGQVKRAYELALVEGATGPILNRMFRGALAAGKRARTETAVGEKGVSIPSVAVELAQRTLGDLSARQVLLIGAGETAELTARSLAARGSDAVFIANRGYNRAISLAERFGGNAVRIDGLPLQLASADIVVSTTNSPHHLIERPELELIMRERDGSPVLLIDLAVPRDIDPECREIEGVSLYDVDEVQAIVERNASGREAEARRAGALIDSELSRFERWMGAQEVMPTVAALRERADAIVTQVLAENATRWESLSATDRERVETLARAIANRLLHEPTVRLKGTADREDAYLQVSALRELFGLDAGTEPEVGSGESADVTSLDERRRRSERG
jgi:glutamyl-tRNA reductase